MTAAKAVQTLIALVFAGAVGYFVYTQAAPLLLEPCKEPIRYTISEIDSRFGISEAALAAQLTKAAKVWNDASGLPLVAAASGEEGIPINLVYSEEQRAAQLGKAIDADQQAYDEKKDELNAMKTTFASMKRKYEAASASYERRVAAYEADVKRSNEAGGAAPAEYQRLQAEGRELDEEREELNAEAKEVNAYSAEINETVDELNAFAKKINAKVNVYNENAGEDFDQGNYVSDKDGKRITIYEFTSQTDLARVLTHEFGHALGIEHVENPDSIMYSFNIGEGLVPTGEDIAALKSACRLD